MSPKQPAPPQRQPSAPNTADALALIDGFADISLKRRRDLKAAVRLLATASGRELEMIPFSQESVQAILAGTTAAACDIGETSFSAYRGHLRFVLTRLAMMPPREAGGEAALSPAWIALFALLPRNWPLIRLRVLGAYCSARSLDPEAVTDTVAAAFLAHRTASDLRGNARASVGMTFRNWNRAMEQIPGWPAMKLTLPAPIRELYTIPVAKMPETFQADLRRFIERMTFHEASSLFDEDAAPRPLSPETITARINGVKYAVAALVQQGMAVDVITGLDVLVRYDNAKAIIDWHHKRAGKKVTTHLGGIADTLRVIAKYHAKLPEAELRLLLPRLKRAKPPKRTSMTAKNMGLLRELEDETKRACLLHLPRELMKRARKLRGGWVDETRGGREIHHPPRALEAAWLAGVAAAIEIELHCPLRIKNLASLRIGHHLQKLDSRRSRFTNLHVPAHEIKNAEDIECVLNPVTAALLAEYVEQYRSALSQAATDWLFPARDAAGQSRWKGGLARAITDTIHEVIGIRLNVHMFRAVAGALILEDDPRATEDVRMILGHKTFATTAAYYKAWGGKEASKRLGGLISRKRQEMHLAAEAAFGGRRRRAGGTQVSRPSASSTRRPLSPKPGGKLP